MTNPLQICKKTGFTQHQNSAKNVSDVQKRSALPKFGFGAGFTLIETLVAVSILTISVIGPMVTANRAIVASQTARDQLIASYLAQEAIEYIRAVRDNAFLSAYPGDGWTGFVSAIETNCSGTARCTVDPWALSMGYGVGSSMMSYTGTPPVLNITGANVYTQQAGTATPFTRTIQVFRANPNANNDERIVATVSWVFHGTTHTVTISDHLTPWQ